MKLYLKNIITLIVLCTFFISSQVASAKFEWFYNSIIIKGEIVPGDYERLIEIIKYMDQPPASYQLDSKGGDVMEAIKIGNMLRDTYTPVTVLNTQICASACFFILVGSPDRFLFDDARIGIHRPYFKKSYFSSLSASEAENKYRKLQTTVQRYLLKMGVPQNFTDMMYRISSEDVNWISGVNFNEKIGEKSPFYEELLLSKCGHDLTAEEYEIYYNRGNKYSKKLVRTVQEQSFEYSTCKMNINSKERRVFMKRLGLKAKNPHNSQRWVGLNATKSSNKYIVTEYDIK